MFNKKDEFKQELQRADKEAISSIIDENMVVTGEISFKGKARIDGTVEGNVNGEHLILSETGSIKGDIKVNSFICHGTITGNVVANLVTAKKNGGIHGKLEAGSLTVEPGAVLNGEIKAATKELHLVKPSEEDKKTKTSNQVAGL